MAGADLCCQPPSLQRRPAGQQRRQDLRWRFLRCCPLGKQRLSDHHSWRFLQRRPLSKQRLSDHHSWRFLQRRPPALAVLPAAGGLLPPCLQGISAGFSEPWRLK